MWAKYNKPKEEGKLALYLIGVNDPIINGIDRATYSAPDLHYSLNLYLIYHGPDHLKSVEFGKNSFNFTVPLKC